MNPHLLEPWGVLLLRLTVGGLFWAHLYWKFFLLEGGLGKWWDLLAASGYGDIVPLYSLTAEFVGAIFITAGFYTRWSALYTLPFMIGAAQFWATRKGFFFTGAGAELPVVWALLLASLALLGDGAWALGPWWRPARRGAEAGAQS